MSAWRRALGWAPAALLAAVLGVHLAGLAAGGLWRTLAWLFLLQLVPLLGLPVLLGALARAAWLRAVPGPVAATALLAAVATAPAVVGYGLVPVRYPFGSLADTVPAATVRLPLDGPVRVVWGGDSLATNYHQADPTQRWAYDLVVEPSALGVSDLTAYGCYGRPVLAPAAGRVALAVDGHPDGDPTHFEPNALAPAGNHVALELPTGSYLVVAHLRPGTVAVAAGDEVAEGQRLGDCGNSGNTSEPHVHLHHQRHDPAAVGLVSEGLPLWFRDHDGPPMPLGGVAVEGGAVRFVGDVVRHLGR